VSVAEFTFSLELTDDSRYDRMLEELAASVCAYAGLAKPSVDDLAATLARAFDAHRGGRCDVRFAVRGGELEIVVAPRDGAGWRATRPLP